jgi:glc operon protein GlcG
MSLALRPLIFLSLLAFAGSTCLAQSPSTVIDDAKMFSSEAIREAKGEMARIYRTYEVVVTIETVDSLRGQTIDEAALRKAPKNEGNTIYVLIAKQDRKVEALATPRVFREEVGKARQFDIQDAFLNEFRKGRVDDGLTKGILAIDKSLSATKLPPNPNANRGGFMPTTPIDPTSAGSSPLILRQQVKLTLAGARKIVEGAEAKALKEGWKMNIAVVDDGGHLLTFSRMDGARPASVATATTKAVSAATFRQATGPMGAAGATPDLLHNLGIENAAAASGAKVTTLPGGLPIVIDGQVIGAIGVGGGVGEQDTEAAKAGIASFVQGLQTKAEEPAKPKEKDKEKEKDEETTKPKESVKEGDAGPK